MALRDGSYDEGIERLANTDSGKPGGCQLYVVDLKKSTTTCIGRIASRRIIFATAGVL
jgi:hypothetical protein